MRGINGDEVESRVLPKSHGTGKTFPGRNCLKTIAGIERWLSEFSDELAERLEADLEQNKRIAQTLTLHASASKGTSSIMNYFHSQDQSYPSSKESNDKEIHEAAALSPSGSESSLRKHLQEPQTECSKDGTKMNIVMQTHQDDESRMFEDKCLKTSTSAPAPTDSYVQELTKKIRQEVAVEVEAKVNQKVCAEVDGKINRKVQDNLTLALKKLAEANPTLNVDIGEICATISSDTVGDGTPMTNGPSS
ncbi:hypothetical protein POM88_025492 [Heracleum sosnowskyi]|uniref:DNA polymerase Y-family little finger domain-containing protein n=1 Tax=Heracleum sosnowskyi TaxID=360622 RepID=A0AAD8I6G1_9APIA|nr:hypothetical protein POM88_025492 [Heracleum sosnowskyi]